MSDLFCKDFEVLDPQKWLNLSRFYLFSVKTATFGNIFFKHSLTTTLI